MCDVAINHEKSSLVGILFSLTEAACRFRTMVEYCPLQDTVQMTKQERYRWLESMGLKELEGLYHSHCECARRHKQADSH